MTENERLTFETELGISIDKNEDCPTMSICWNCDIPPRKCNYFKDAIDKLAKYEAIGTVEEFKALKEKNEPKEPDYEGDGCWGGRVVIDTWICPNCEKHYEVDYDDYDYCPNCGQHIDHSWLTEDN